MGHKALIQSPHCDESLILIIVILCWTRYEITMTLTPIAHPQCGQSARRMLTSAGEKMENHAECHYSDKLKEYKISMRLSVFHTTKKISLLQNESISI